MNNVNFIKNIDNLGRIVIPMDIRRKLQINTGDVLSITCNDKNIMLTKYSSLVNNQKVVEIIKSVIDVFNVKLILTNKDCVLYSNIVNYGGKLDNNTRLLVNNGSNLKNTYRIVRRKNEKNFKRMVTLCNYYNNSDFN